MTVDRPARGRLGRLGRLVAWWRALDGRARLAVALATLLVGVNLVLLAVDAVFPSPGGPAASSYATGPDGVAAYADLLRRNDHRVERLLEPPSEVAPDPNATLVLLAPESLLPDDVAALRRFVERGGRLVAGGPEPTWVEPLLGRSPRWSPASREEAHPLAPVPATSGVEEVRSAGLGAWRDAAGTLPVLGDDKNVLLVTARVGDGTVALLADVSPLTNALLASADNAALGQALAGEPGRPVLFQEAVHGFGGGATGLDALPRRFKVALAGLVVAGLLLIAARYRRLGPPEAEERPLPPARTAYIEAMAAALKRTRQPSAAAAPVREAALGRVTRRAGLSPDARPEDVDAAGERLGLSKPERRALSAEDGDEQAALAAGRVLARLERGPSR